jgi:hypothetical protein
MPLPTIPSGNVASALPSGYDVDNSCRFNRADSPYMHITPGGDGDLRKFTVSFWCKRGTLTTGSGTGRQVIFSTATNDAITFDGSNDKFAFLEDGGDALVTNRVFRDCSAWYHIVVAVDTEQGVAANRIKLYVNGVLETSFSTTCQTSQDADMGFGKGSEMMSVGRSEYDDNRHFDGYLAEFYYINNSQLAASDFGEFDEDSPTIWKPKDASGLTFGTNGFYLDFEDSSNLGNDANGGTDLTEVNLAAADSATDTPTNNFATLNPLDNYYAGGTFSEGNCTYVTASEPYAQIKSTFNVSKGKWFWEVKNVDGTATMIGASGATVVDATHGVGLPTASCAYYIDGRKVIGNVLTSYGTSYTDNDIIGVALNLDDDEITFYKNGTAQNSGTAISIVAAASAPNGGYSPAVSDESNDTTQTLQCNFGGCPAFAISSGNSDADGYGNFEYAVPSGYYSLCTKNLAEYG